MVGDWNKILKVNVFFLFVGGTSVSNALECPHDEKRTIVSLDTSQMVCGNALFYSTAESESMKYFSNRSSYLIRIKVGRQGFALRYGNWAESHYVSSTQCRCRHVASFRMPIYYPAHIYELGGNTKYCMCCAFIYTGIDNPGYC